MELKYSNKMFGELEFNSKNNIVTLYGKNNTGKTRLLLDIYRDYNKSNFNVYSKINLEGVIHINEIPDLKKEIDLSKQSILRKKIKEVFSKTIDFENYEINDWIKQKLEEKGIYSKMINTISTKYKNNKVVLEKVAGDIDSFIDYFFNLEITNESNDEIDISTSISKILYYELILFNEAIENKLILLDCPDTFLDEEQCNYLKGKLINLSKENIVILTTRNNNVFNLGENYFKFGEQWIPLKIDDNFALNYVSMIEYDKVSHTNFDLIKMNVEKTLIDDDIIKLNNFIKTVIPFFIKCYELTESKEFSKFNEYLNLLNINSILIIFLMFKNLNLNTNLFKSNLSNKFIEFLD